VKENEKKRNKEIYYKSKHEEIWADITLEYSPWCEVAIHEDSLGKEG